MANQRVIVIGAGAAGIAAATRLLENGFQNVKILEAEKRIGGRINTISFGNNVVDMGAQWCHGEKNNAVFGLANKYDLFDSTTTRYDRFQFVRSNGEWIDQDKGDKLMILALSIIEDCKDELKVYSGSLGSFIVKKFNEVINSTEFNFDDKELAAQFFTFFHKYENSIEASESWFDTSGEGYLHYWDCDGDRLLNWKNRGYKTVLDIMMKKYPGTGPSLPIDSKIELGKTVKKIEWLNLPATNVRVECNDGTVLDADHVIVTVSLGVLKEKYQTLFAPALPEIKQNAIRGLELGTVDKIFLEFDKPFWTSDWLGFSLLWTMNDVAVVRESADCWLEDVFGFYVVDYQPNILCAWISGANARRMEICDVKRVQNGLMGLLRQFLKNWTIPEPKRMERSCWYANPNFRGSYSYRSVATDLLKTSASDLALPLMNAMGKPVVQFAGEATHDHYYSTVHGAIETGWREAKRIIDHYQSGFNVQLGLRENQFIDFDIVILGAGLAGLGAGTVLSNSDRSFCILEAGQKAGGRIQSVDFGDGKSIEAGAQWLHGQNNELYEVAYRHNLISSTLSDEGGGPFFREDSTQVDDYFVKRVDFAVGQILEKCEQFAANNTVGEYPKSVGEYLRGEFKQFMASLATQVEQTTAAQLLDWHIRFQMIDNSCDTLDSLSARSWGNYSFNGSDGQAHINVRDCFAELIDRLENEIIGRDKFRFNSEVVKVDWNVLANQDARILIGLADESCVIRAKQVVCTFSLGVLKERKHLFVPRLPAAMDCAVQRLGFGTINKIFLQFDQPWWGQWHGIQLLRSNADKLQWTRHISGFDIVQAGPPNTLVGWVGGQGAIEMEHRTDAEIVNDCIDLLIKFTACTVAKPVRHFVTRWHSNRFVRGSYSYTSTACDSPPVIDNTILNTAIDMTALKLATQSSVQTAERLDSKPIILLAGEAGHRDYFSTAHGAFLSGIEQAKILVSSALDKCKL